MTSYFDIVHNDPLYMQYSEEERHKMDEEQMEYLEEKFVAEFNRKKSFGAQNQTDYNIEFSIGG